MPAYDERDHVDAEKDVSPLLPFGQRLVLGLLASLGLAGSGRWCGLR